MTMTETLLPQRRFEMMATKTKTMLMAAMSVSLIGTAASAASITISTDAPTSFFASGGVDATSFTRVFADGARPADGNEGRGNEILVDSGSLADYTMTALVLRKSAAQNFGTTTANLTLYVFEGTNAQWDAGNGQADGDLWDETGITTTYSETFSLNGLSFADGDYVSFNLDTSINMAANMGWFLKMNQGDSGIDFFEIAQNSNPGSTVVAADGIQYQAPDGGHLVTGSPLEYYAVPEPGSLALLGLGGLLIARRRRA